MYTDRNNSRQPGMSENDGDNQGNGQKEEGKTYESDTQRIVHRHLENKDDVITDEDIASVRIGVSPPLDEATEARFEDDEAQDETEEDYTGDLSDEPDTNTPGQLTPWDIQEG